jgi:RNA polymerase sigma factor (sigma-70 family)
MLAATMEDAQLLRRYVEARSEADFAELVRRHVDLVFSAALRQVGGDPHRAEEVTQMVFISLARKASSLWRHPCLPAWLYQSTRFAASNVRREEQRRLAYERAAVAQLPTDADPAGAADWDQLRPVLDDAMNELSGSDREAVLLRFFSNRPFVEIGRRLGLNENAARMRVDRALDKLHAQLARRGITSTAAALTVALSANAVLAAPAGVAAAATGAALSGTVGASGFVFLNLMSSIKLQASVAVLLLAAGTTTIVLQQQSNTRLQGEIDDLNRQSGISGLAQAIQEAVALRAENGRLAQATAEAMDLREGNADLDHLRAEANVLRDRTTASVAGEGSRMADPLPPGVYNPDQLDQMPIALQQVQPIYPPAMKLTGSEGQAIIGLIVGPDGTTTDVKAINSSDPAFADPAVTAVQQWKFTPGQLGGQPVGVKLQVPIKFLIQDTSGNWF